MSRIDFVLLQLFSGRSHLYLSTSGTPLTKKSEYIFLIICYYPLMHSKLRFTNWGKLIIRKKTANTSLIQCRTSCLNAKTSFNLYSLLVIMLWTLPFPLCQQAYIKLIFTFRCPGINQWQMYIWRKQTHFLFAFYSNTVLRFFFFIFLPIFFLTSLYSLVRQLLLRLLLIHNNASIGITPTLRLLRTTSHSISYPFIVTGWNLKKAIT